MLGNNTPCPREYIGYRTNYNPLVGSHGGCLIYIRRDIPYIPLSLNTPLQAVAMQVDLTRRYTLCSLYLPPNDPVSYEDLVELTRQLPQPFLLLGDMNARHPLWGDLITNQKGNIFSSLIENEDLGVLNTGEPTHFHIQTGTLSCIDLSLGSSNCTIDFSWKTTDDWHSSDHAPIIISSNDGPPVQRLPRWCLDKANWTLFMTLSMILLSIDDMSTVNDAVDLLNGILHSAGVASIPRTTGLFRRRPVPWWSNELKLLHRATRTALTRCRNHRTEENVIEYKRNRARFRRAIKAARRQSWANFISTINSKTPQSVIWQKIRKIAGKFTPSPPPVLKVNGNYITDAQEVSNIFAEHFACVSRKCEEAPGYRHRHREEHRSIDFTSRGEESYNLPFTTQEFDSALGNCNDTAPGPDEIPYVMLRHISNETKLFVIGLLNRIWRESNFPDVWEIATVLPFCKPGKDRFVPTSYRPIALTSCLCKLMEKMVNVRLVWFLERKCILSPAQCGFRKMHSTTDVLIRLESSICEAFASRQHHVTVFFDLEKAYDTAWRYGILKAVHECGLRGEMPLFIKAFLTNRFFRVKIGNTVSDRCRQEEGVPQGCVLSVTLFALAINGITSVLPPGVLYTLFVDDLSLSFAASRMAVAERKLQLSIDRTVNWAERNGFKFSTTKTVAMHFCRIRGVHPDPDLYLNGQRIPCVEETRFLGLMFDHRLTWVAHVKYIKTKCLEALNILRVLSHTSWGADRQTLLRLHKAFIISKLSYGCEIYSSATQSRLKSLDSVHHAGIRLATGAFKSSPIPSLLVDAGELPLDLYRQSSLVRYWYRVQRLPDSLAYKTTNGENCFNFYETHSSYPHPFGFRVKQILTQLHLAMNPVCPFKFSVTPPWKLPIVRFCRYFGGIKKNMLDEEIRLIFLEHVVEHDNSVLVFTDGSKSNAGVGYGVASNDFSRRGALPSVASNFTAELYGILTALEQIATLDDESFTIFCDSKSVLQSLEGFDVKHPVVLKILQWVYLHQCRGREILFCWVPAHVNVAGNERADQLAKSAAAELRPRRCPLPLRDFFPDIKVSIRNVWQERWDAVGPNKMREITGRIAPWRYSRMPRRWETALCRLRIGHTRKTHGFLMAGEYQPFCDDCLVPLTVKHLLIECPSLGDLRESFLSDSRGEDGSYILAKVLGEDVLYDTSDIFCFVEAAGLLKDL